MDERQTNLVPLIAQAITILIATGFVISLLYDWGFAKALGVNLRSIPLTTEDFFYTGVLWLPYLIIFVTASIAWEFYFKRVENGLTEEEIIQSSRNPESTRRFRDGPWRLMQWTAPIVASTFLLVGDTVSAVLPFMLSIMWMTFAEWTYSRPLIQARRNWKIHALFTFAPIILIFSFFSGYNAAVTAASQNTSTINVLTSEQRTIHGRLLRELSRGLLLLNKANRVVFIPWQKVTSITDESSYKPFQGIPCEWFQYCVEKAANKKIEK